MHHPNQGRFCEYTESNIEKAKSGKLLLDIPDLNFSCSVFLPSTQDHSYSEGNMHPVARTRSHFCAFDRFHEGNSKLEKDILRRLDIVKQTRAAINSQVVEELFSYLQKSRYFLTQFDPVCHIFVVRLLLHLRNKRMNYQRLQSVQQKMADAIPGCVISFSADMRMVMEAKGMVILEVYAMPFV